METNKADRQAYKKYRKEAISIYTKTEEGKQDINFLGFLTFLWVMTIIVIVISVLRKVSFMLFLLSLVIYVLGTALVFLYSTRLGDKAVKYRQDLEDKEDGNESKS